MERRSALWKYGMKSGVGSQEWRDGRRYEGHFLKADFTASEECTTKIELPLKVISVQLKKSGQVSC